VKEQSHKDEMSAALRGDFQRLRARGVSPSLAPHEAPEPVDGPEEGTPADVPLDLIPASLPDAPDDEPSARRGWLSRFGGR
jgi:hypothetical protein